MKKRKGYKLRRYNKYYWFYYTRERVKQVLVFILTICIITVLAPFAFIKEFSENLWDCKYIFKKLPTRKAIKKKLIELKLN